VKLRSSLLLAPVVAGLTLGTLAPAHAADAGSPSVDDLTVSVAQTPGRHDSWQVTAAWSAVPGATQYDVVIADHDDGTVTSGKSYGNQDTAGTTVSLRADRLVADRDYWVAVRPIRPAGGTVTLVPFHTAALDTTAPTGSYGIDRTAGYLLPDEDLEDFAARFVITQKSLAGAKTRMVLAGDGTPAQAWRSGRSFSLAYTAPGRYTPHVLVTDEFDNTRDIALPAVRVRSDDNAPRIRITRPAQPDLAASWRRVRGTASDAETGLAGVGVFVLEKRGEEWWAYDFDKRTWLKGFPSPRKTMNQTDANAFMMQEPAAGRWRTPVIKGLTAGTLRVEAIAYDYGFNFVQARGVKREVR
jgi:hypothetical protein